MGKRFVCFKSVLIILLFCSFGAVLGAQQPSQAEQLRILIWSSIDPFPGSFDEPEGTDKDAVLKKTAARQASATAAAVASPAVSPDDPYVAEKLEVFGYAIERTKEITPFLLSGMISGWAFDYVPYDKTRRVQEIFEVEEVTPFSAAMNPISYKNPEPLENRLVCWAYCDRTEAQQLSYRRWTSVQLPKIHGKGAASVEGEFEGIQAACKEAVKNAVREYWRIYEKNKPKEILGKVLLIGNPRIYISEGQYVADLEFFLETDRIVKYTTY